MLSAQDKNSGSQGLPPLIDRELLFGNPEIAGAQLSPDGQYIAFLKPWNDTRNVWVKKTASPSAPRACSPPRPSGPSRLSLDPRQQVHPLRQGQRRRRELQRLRRRSRRPNAGGKAPCSAVARPHRAEGRARCSLRRAQERPRHVYIGLNDRDKAWHDLYKLKISTGEKTLVRKNTERIAGWIFDLTGTCGWPSRIADNGDTEILRVDPDGLHQGLLLQRLRDLRPLRVSQGRQAGLHGDQQGRR